MSIPSLTLNSIEHGTKLSLTSPMLGRASLMVSVGQWVSGGQTVANLHRLGSRFHLKMPVNAEGRITAIKDHDWAINVGYGDTLMVIDTELAKIKKSTGGSEAIDGQDESFIESPMDGMFYSKKTPDSPPFVKIGDLINPGQTVGVIEVMKSFYPLNYQGSRPAKIVGINIENATGVNTGTKLYSIMEK